MASFQIHSKLKTMSFPDFAEVVEICVKANDGAEPETVTKTQWNCNIL